MSRLNKSEWLVLRRAASAGQPKFAVATYAPQPIHTVLADKKIGGHLPNCQRAKLSILALYACEAKAQKKKSHPGRARNRAASRLRPDTMIRIARPVSTGRIHDFSKAPIAPLRPPKLPGRISFSGATYVQVKCGPYDKMPQSVVPFADL